MSLVRGYKSKKFGDLIPREDNIYWIDPYTSLIMESLVLGVEIMPKDMVKVRYLRNAKLDPKIPLSTILQAKDDAVENLEKALVVDRNLTHCLTFSKMPTMVCTNQTELQEWMKNSH